MAVKKKPTQEEALAKQRAFNAELVKSGAWKWQDGRLVPNDKIGYDEANTMVGMACKNVTEKPWKSRR